MHVPVYARRTRIFDMTDITDQLAQALEKVRSYNEDIVAGRINYRPEDHIQVIDAALAAYRASKEGEADGYDKSRPYCPHCNFPHVSLGSYTIDLNTGKLLDPSEQHEH